jgi:hypothetical protein
MKHLAGCDFWQAYGKLPDQSASWRIAASHSSRMIRVIHPSSREDGPLLVGSHRPALRALAVEEDGDLAVFWIGSHADYDAMMR